ncbi:MAG: flagellar biosynthesis protein FlhF [Pseudomonadota bacterium]|nr:flagellar biosynthesis protein FlhF [Pseudomonadales bacterium]MDY6919467.1 flagellar biosynthesis protein FlhF [Pseudomonadota bacterium]
MNTKKFIAADMRQALNLVREQLGADAVILSNRKVEGGIEIVAAADYDAFVEQHRARERQQRHIPEFMADSAAPPAQGDPSRVVDGTREPLAGQARADVLEALRRREQADSGSAYATEMADDEPRVAISARARTQQSRVPQEQPARYQPAPPLQPDPELAAMRGELKQLRQMLNMQMANVAWGNFSQRNPLAASVFKKLSRLGLAPALCRKLIRNLEPEADMKAAWRQALLELGEDLPLLPEDITAHGGVFAFVGPAGVGKTTTIAKIATRFVLEQGAENLALITTDSYRIAGHEQLSTLGRILNVPVRVVTEQHSLEQLVRSLSRKKLVLIDTAGLSHKDQVHREQMAMLSAMGAQVQRWLVLSSTSQRRILDRAVNEYKHLNLEGCILTKLDESASLGEALSVAIESQLPIAYITDGQNIPDDIARPQATRLINHAIALAKEYRPDDELVADMYSDAMADQTSDLAYG